MFDFLLELSYLTYKNGFTISLAVSVVYFILKNERTKKKLKNRMPWLFGSDSEVKDYVKNQRTIMSKQDALLANQKNIAERLGVEWIAPISIESSVSLATKKEKSLHRHLITSFFAQFAKSITKFGGILMKKLKSRKFILALVTGILLVLKDGLGIEVDSETVIAFVGIVATWIAGESYVDGKRASSTDTKDGSDYHH